MNKTILGQIYVFKIHAFCKIGMTRNDVMLRKSNINTSSPYPVEKVYSTKPICNCKEIEKRIHSLLRNYHTHGEWFRVKFDNAVAIVKKTISDAHQIDWYEEAALKMQQFYEKTMEVTNNDPE